jgi:hypothetical protein
VEYFLLDLERTLLSGVPYFWKSNKRGYTYKIQEAGVYEELEALMIAEWDIDKRTVLVNCKTAKEILSMKIK